MHSIFGIPIKFLKCRYNYSTQKGLKCQILDKRGYLWTLLPGLYRAFDCLFHDPLVAKLHACGFDISALRLHHNYLINKKAPCQVWSYNKFMGKYTICRIQSFSVMFFIWSIFFFFINDIDIASYANYNTPYTADKNPENIIEVLEDTSVDLLPWFKNNGMQANADKSHLLVNSKEKLCAEVGPCDIYLLTIN